MILKYWEDHLSLLFPRLPQILKDYQIESQFLSLTFITFYICSEYMFTVVNSTTSHLDQKL